MPQAPTLRPSGPGTGTIVNDDAAVGPGVPFVNEIHYDNAGNDSGEAIEIAGRETPEVILLDDESLADPRGPDIRRTSSGRAP